MAIDQSGRLGPLGHIVGYQLRRASAIFRKDFDEAVTGLDIRQVTFGCLSVIHANPGVQPGQIARMLDIQRANMVSLINELTDKGWVERKTDENDRRAIALSITPEGDAAFTAALQRIEAHEEALLANLSAKERGELVRLLERLNPPQD